MKTMRVFKVNYERGDGKSFVAGILSDDKDKALHFLRKNVPNVKRINSVSAGDADVHAITDEIVNRVIEQNKDKKTESKQSTQQVDTTELEKEKKKLQKDKDKIEYDLQELKTENQSLKNRISDLKQKAERADMVEEQLEQIRTQGTLEKVYVCDICQQEFKSQGGLKSHKTRVHTTNADSGE